MNTMTGKFCSLNTLAIGVLVISLLMSPASTFGQMEADTNKEVDAVALAALQQALDVVRKTKSYSLMGMMSAEESKEAVLGTPLPIREIGYNSLLKYKEGSDPKSVFVAGPEQMLYPVLVKDEVRSSLTLVKKEQTWQMTSYGDADRTTEIEKARMILREETGGRDINEVSYSLVTVPAFGLYFVAQTQGDRTLLKPVNPMVAADLGLEGLIEEKALISRLSAYTKEFEEKYGEAIRQRRLVK